MLKENNKKQKANEKCPFTLKITILAIPLPITYELLNATTEEKHIII